MLVTFHDFCGHPIQTGFNESPALLVPLTLVGGSDMRRALCLVNHSLHYEEYLKSQHWADLREACFNSANRRCEACKGLKQLRGHHLRYAEDLTTCTIEDIMCLCERCHSLWHKRLTETGGRLDWYCRQSTRGALAVLLKPMKEKQKPKGFLHPPDPRVLAIQKELEQEKRAKKNGKPKKILAMPKGLEFDLVVDESFELPTRRIFRRKMEQHLVNHPNAKQVINRLVRIFKARRHDQLNQPPQKSHRTKNGNRIEGGVYRA